MILATGGVSYPATGSTGDGYCVCRPGPHDRTAASVADAAGDVAPAARYLH